MGIHPADPDARRRAVIVVAVAGVLGAALLLVVERQLDRITEWFVIAGAMIGFSMVGVFVGAMLSLPLLGLGAWVRATGTHVVRSGRFPPPGAAVVRPTPVLEGEHAVRRGELLRALGAVIVAGAFAIPLLFAYVCSVLERS